MKLGTTCVLWPECGEVPTLTGLIYTDKIVQDLYKGKTEFSNSLSLGISRISDE